MSLTHTCRISGKEFVISDQEITLLDKLAPIIGGERFSLPIPTICPEERRRRRLQFKNYFTLFKRKDSLKGTPIISMFPPDSPFIVYTQEDWWSDGWDAMDFGQEYKQDLPVTDQIYALRLRVPYPALDNAYKLLENSEYINGNGASKNCYLISNGNENENCLYGWYIFSSRNILNVNYARYVENCSFSCHLWRSYDVHYSFDISECKKCWYSFSCEGCECILGGVGLRNQKYAILNTPCTVEEYENTLIKLHLDIQFKKQFEQKLISLIYQVGISSTITTGSVDSTGDFCYDSKNCTECYFIGDSEDALYITNAYDVTDSIGLDQWGDRTSLCYECTDTGENVSHIYWSNSVWGGAKYNFYSTKCVGCSYIFGCVGLKNQSYCIFNKQYKKEEWEDAVKKIIHQMKDEGSWGEYLDPKYAFYAYNESHAMEQMPLTREDIIQRGLKWVDREEIAPKGITKIIPGERLPDRIEDVPNDILNWAIKCPETGKLFQIQPLELELHRSFGMALPQLHPLERIKKLLSWDKRIFSFDF